MKPVLRTLMGSSSNRPLDGLLSSFIQRRGLLFVVIVVLVFIGAGYNSRESTTYHVLKQYPSKSAWLTNAANSLLSSDNHPAITQHPIPKLMDEAEAQYRKKVKSQSKTLTAAVAEYKKRYKSNPPKGFDQWFKFAQQHDVVMIDEYDGLMQDLAPFRQISGQELRRRSRQVAELPSIDLVRIEHGTVEVVKDDLHDMETGARASGFAKMLERFVQKLPDMEFPINAKAEGRVLVSWEHRAHLNSTLQDNLKSGLGGPFRASWDDDGNVWEAWRLTCDPSSPARRLYSSLGNSLSSKISNYLDDSVHGTGRDFKFAKTTSAQVDFCKHPHAHYMQGHFFSDWRTIPGLYPVFSPAKTKGFLDIRIPSHYYYGSTPAYTYGWDSINVELKDVDPMEVPWEEKIDKIFWRGATTGGGNHPPGFMPHYQRHRFLRMASNSTDGIRLITYADPPSSTTNFVTTQVSAAKLNEEIMDTAFTKVMMEEAYPGGIEALLAVHRFGSAVPLGRHWSYRYLVDLDGMGYSGRFMAFLSSDSVPIKSTVYDEFFSNWIMPWVHFIPLSTTYKEIYNIYSYFTGPTKWTLEAANSTLAEIPIEKRRSEEGDKRLRRIAHAGKHWKKTVGRKVDMEVYVYRLCLEWARLWADDRDSMTFTL